MKRIIPFAAALLVAMSSQAQTVNVHMADKSTVKYAADKVEYVDFSSALVAPQGVEAVDLELPSGLKWASMNVGATAPEEAGSYFAWGETEPSDNYGWDNYALGYKCNEILRTTITKYNFTLNPDDDAATLNWGPRWRMPTKSEFDELLENTTAEYLILPNDSPVVKLTSKVAGFTDKYVLFSLPGYINGRITKPTFTGQFAYYWSSTLDVKYIDGTLKQHVNAYQLAIETDRNEKSLDNIEVISDRRPHGLSVRPVLAKSDGFSDAPEGAEAIDLGLSVKWANMNVGATAPEEWGKYYAWGETTTNYQYGWYHNLYTGEVDELGSDVYVLGAQNYKWGTYDKGITGYTGVVTLEPEDDAATANWGNEWRTPTKEDFEELIANTKIRKETINGVKGVKFTSETNGNSIFIPYSGSQKGTQLVEADANGGCWTATLDAINQEKGVSYRFQHEVEASAKKLNSDYRPLGLPVRPVKK